MARFALLPLAASLPLAGVLLPAQPPSDPAKQRLICREAERSLGSHIRTPRRCRTAEQWQQEDEAKARLPVSATITEGQGDGVGSRRPPQ